MAYNAQDAQLTKTKALPASAGSASTDAIDLGTLSNYGARVEDIEVELTRPALGATPIPDTKTITYKIESDTTSAFSSATQISVSVVETGADSAGVDGGTTRFKVPSNCERYIRATATTGTGTADCSDSSMTLKIKS